MEAFLSNSENIFDYLDEMRKTGTPEDIVSRKVISFLQGRARETDTPYSGHFELTPLCNLNCKMCYVHLNSNQLKEKKLLSANEWIELIQQAIDYGMIKATLSGGECLTYPEFDEVYLFLQSKGIATSILTNGVLLDKRRISFFQEHKPRKIQISLYGSSDDAYENVTGKGVFSTVINNVLNAKDAGLPIKISITPSKYMLPDIKNTIRLLNDINVPYAINMGLMTPRADTQRDTIEHDISIEDYVEIIKFNRKINNRVVGPRAAISYPEVTGIDTVNKGLKCAAGRSTFAINWLGIMNPCTQMNSIVSHPLNEGFKKAWNSINMEVKSFPRFKDCETCKYSSVCYYCAAENEKLGSRYILNKRWCEKTWKMVSYGLRVPDPQCD